MFINYMYYICILYIYIFFLGFFLDFFLDFFQNG